MPKKFNPDNERLKRVYLTYMREAQQHGEASLDAIAKAIHRFETYTRFRAFRAFHVEQATAFKRNLASSRNERTGTPLSHATQYSTLAVLKAFFRWLAGQPGFKKRLRYSDADYFSMSRGDSRIAKANCAATRVPSLEQARTALMAMPVGTDIERRDQALFAFILLTGARDGAVPSLRRKHVDMETSRVLFDAREVHTKFRKTFPTWFFPVGDDVQAILQRWVDWLDHEALWSPDDPLFPATRIEVGPDCRFRPVGLDRKFWRTAAPIRAVFKGAFERAGLPYFGPHSFRKTLTQLGQRRCGSPEQYKAWSQNLGHDHVMTTFTSYGAVSLERQAEIIRGLAATPNVEGDPVAALKRLVSQL